MEPFRDRDMDSSQRSMDASQGSQGQQRSPLRQTSPSHAAPGAALARPPTFGSVGSPGMPAAPPGYTPNQGGYGYTGQSLAAPPGQQQATQNQRLLQMQRQQQLRQLHSQRRHPTSQQSQSLSQLQQNYMQHLAADNLGNSQRSTGSSVASAPSPNHSSFAGGAEGSQQQGAASPSQPRPNGIPPPSSSSHMMNRTDSHSSMNMNHAPMNMNFMPPTPAPSDPWRNSQQQKQPPKDSPPPASGQTKSAAPMPASRPGFGSRPTNVAGGTLHPNMPPPSATNNANGTKGSLTAPPPANPLPPLPAVDDKEVPGLLAKCDFRDKTLWVSRQLLGGQALNKFLGSTANVQRIKRQRVRQLRVKDTPPAPTAAKGKADDTVSVSSNPSVAGSTAAAAAEAKKRKAPPPPSEDDQEVKLEVMNSRTAKKIKSEMEIGMKFCELMHETVRGILKEMDVPGVAIPAALGPELPVPPADRMPSLLQNTNASKSTTPTPKPPTVTKQTSRAVSTAMAPPPAPPAPAPLPVPRVVQQPPPSTPASPQSTTAAGSAKNSTLRRNRRKKLPPSNSLSVGLSEFDANGKRLLSKKDFSQRVFEVIRFRALRQGDHVAARLSSRDLWILARVMKDYPSVSMPSVEFLQLSAVRRDALFRDKVLLQDVEEDKDSGHIPVARNLVLPLPRYSEAAEWGQHYRKGSRVYAMYPETTSLYTGTVFDNTTYCQGDDDIIVVEFDGDEPDHTGSPPKCHIPARFVTLIPREFPSFQDKATRRQSTTAAAPPAASGQTFAGFADPLNNLDLTLDAMESFDGFDDLDFDLELG